MTRTAVDGGDASSRHDTTKPARPRTERRLPRWSELRPLLRPRPLEFDPTERRLSRALTVDDLRTAARRRTPLAVFDYTDGAAEAETSARRAREAFERVEFQPRVLRDVTGVDTSTTVLGRASALPLAFAPTGFTRMMHHQGERAVVRVAEAVGIPYAWGRPPSRTSPPPRPAPAGGSSCTCGATAAPARSWWSARRRRATRP
jgi:hypothetical protein